ncbi:MAG: hypothetical protein KAJ62_04100 [Desulfobacteraceae bacterium]|nr:hypothetical protein [Desulfobacteraceae bacterium]
MIIDLIFYTGFALLITHELDAIQRHEWRIFPFLSNLEEDIAYQIFVIAHVPLLVSLLWLMNHPSENVRYWFQLSLDIFLIIHLGLHSLLKSHKKNEFTSVLSKIIIMLMALFGLLHLILLIINNNV